ncbi:MAG TPA: hypothetical protein VKX17_17150 [Planctomycetota bacterium]|nr:hypothetical protein [Planctomycetota bacterium]
MRVGDVISICGAEWTVTQLDERGRAIALRTSGDMQLPQLGTRIAELPAAVCARKFEREEWYTEINLVYTDSRH